MKIRQKIAMLLAAAMTLTAVPMVTMAKSDFSLTNGVLVREKDDEILATQQKLKVELKDEVTTTTMFFVNIENAKWLVNDTATPLTGSTGIVAGTYKKNSDTEVQVVLTAGDEKDVLYIPLNVELKGGEATVSVDGNGTVVSDWSKVVFAKTSDTKAAVTFGDTKNVYLQGPVGKVTIEEPFAGVMDKNEFIEIELDNPDYDFVLPTATNFSLTRGFSGFSVTNIQFGSDKGIIKFKVSDNSAVAAGRIEVKDLEVKAKDRKPAIGDDISVTVKGEDITDTTGKVAVSTAVGSKLVMKDDKVVDVVAGTKKDITFKLVENVDDSVLDGRLIAFTLDKGYFWNKALKVNTSDSALDTQTEVDAMVSSAIAALKGKIEMKDDTSFTFSSFDLIYDNDKDKRVVGFEFIIDNAFETDRVDELTVKDVTVYMPLDKEGDVTITAEGRGLGEELTVNAVNILTPVEITSEALVLKVGLKEQTGGKIVITETDKGMLKQGQTLVIEIDEKDDGFKFSDTPEIKVVSGDLQLDMDSLEDSDSQITVDVKRASKTASVIEITMVPVTVDRTVPQGNYDVKVKGGALQKDHTFGSLTVEEFIKVATANTEDITANGLKKGTSSFVIGSSKYVTNGVEAEMDGAVYLDNGRTMVPVRYVANALGVPATDIFFASGTATILAGSKTVSLTVGDKVAKLNGAAARTMVSAPVVKDGRTYVPVAEIGALLGVEATWDSAAQTATFTNK